MSKIDSMDLIMLSNFDRSGGGMETWAYGFIPILIKSNPKLILNIFGLTPKGKTDNTQELLNAVDNDSKDRLRPRFFNVKWTKIPWFFSMFFQFRSYCKNNYSPPPRIVLGVGGVFELLNLLYIRKYKKSKKVLWLRTIFFNEKASRIPSFSLNFARKLEVYFLKKVDVLIANGDDIANHYEKLGLKVSVIKNGVDLKKWEATPPFLSNDIRVAFIGRLAKAKGIEEFLEVVKLIKSKTTESNFEFYVCGEGPYFKQVKDLENKNMLSYMGVIDNQELPSILESFDVCVALTLVSPMGGGGGTSNALLEQMAAGRVIVAWKNVIFNQLLDNENSFLAEQGNIQDLADQIIKVSLDIDAAKLKAEKGKTLMSKFSIEAQIVKFNKVIRDNFVEK